LRKTKLIEESELDPWTLFLNCMRADLEDNCFGKKEIFYLIFKSKILGVI